MSALLNRLSPLLGILWLLILWWGLTAFGVFETFILPKPAAVLHSAYELTANGKLPLSILVSLRRIAIGFALAMLMGGVLGLLAGFFHWPRLLLQPPASFLRYIPPTAFVALFILYFGVGEGYKIAVIIAGNIFFVFAMTMDAVDQVDRRYLEMRAVTGESRIGLFLRVILPAVAPRLINVARVNVSGAWIFLVVAEITGADSGLGYLIAQAQRFMRTEELFVGIIMFGIIGLLTDLLLRYLGRWLFPWDQASQRKTGLA
jgi:NitT/TauT family transport system permease protein